MKSNVIWGPPCLGLPCWNSRDTRRSCWTTKQTRAHWQRAITAFFRPFIPTHATSQSSALMTRKLQRLTINQAIAICHACKPQPREPQLTTLPLISKAHYLLPSQVLPSLKKLSISDQSTKYNLSYLRILHALITRLFSHFDFYLHDLLFLKE